MSEQKADRKVVGKCEISIFAWGIRVQICAEGEDSGRKASEIADAVWAVIDRQEGEEFEHSDAWSRRTEDQPQAKSEL